MKKFVLALLATASLTLTAQTADAAAIIIAGTDADDHGFASGGANESGWLFMQLAFENIRPSVANGNTTVTCLGCNGGTASLAFQSAFDLSTLPGAGFSRVELGSDADVANFFNGTGTTNINNTAIIYMPTVNNNVSGGITDTQLAIVNTNAVQLNNFAAGGGGLFTQEQANSSIGYGWLTTLLPGLQFHGDNDGSDFDSSTLTLTADGSAAFPGLTNSDIQNATPWHSFFTGNFGALESLIIGPADSDLDGTLEANEFGTAVLGAGVGGVIVDPGDVPEPASLTLLGLGAISAAFIRRRRRQS